MLLERLGVTLILTASVAGGCGSSPSPTPPTVTPASPSLGVPGPEPSVDRKFTCRAAAKLAGEAAGLQADFMTDPGAFGDVAGLAGVINDMRHLQGSMSPEVSLAYEPIVAPLNDLVYVLQYGSQFDPPDDYEAPLLHFMQKCNAWAGNAGTATT